MSEEVGPTVNVDSVKRHFRIDDRLSITFTDNSQWNYGLLTVVELTCKLHADELAESGQSNSSIHLTRSEFGRLLDFFITFSNKECDADSKDSWEFNKPIWTRLQTDPRACPCHQAQSIYFDRCFSMAGRIRIGSSQELYIDRISIEKMLIMKSELLASLAELVPDDTEFNWPPWQVMPCGYCPSVDTARETESPYRFEFHNRSRSPIDRESPSLLDSSDSQ